MTDFTSTTYDYRWQRFYDALKKAHPKVNYVASAHLEGVHLPAVDVHDFSGPDFFYDAFSRYIICLREVPVTIVLISYPTLDTIHGLGTVQRQVKPHWSTCLYTNLVIRSLS